jgi:phospholipase C
MNRLRLSIGLLVAVAFGVAAAPAKAGLFTSLPPLTAPADKAGDASPDTTGLSKIKHLIFIIQENRSFDEFFGTYPGADGIPTNPPCQVDPWYPSNCDTPYPNHNASNQGGPYNNPYQVQDIDGGKMDGFIESREQELGPKCAPQKGRPVDRNKIIGYTTDEEGIKTAKKCIIDVMGYHDGKDLPNYWQYAQNYVLFDHFFESAESWSLPAHLALFSGWAAKCTQVNPPDINSCSSDLNGSFWSPQNDPEPYLWTDITYLLYKHNITWNAYLDGGLGNPIGGNTGVQGIWAVLGGFETVNDDGQYNNAVGIQATQFYTDAQYGTLPQVSWVLPDYVDSDHPQASVKNGQTFVTSLVNAVENGPDWDSSVIFVMWDDMGGFYDHEPPPFNIDFDGPGMRVSAMMISPYAKAGTIDHQIFTSDSFLHFIEETFTKGKGIATAGRPDPRPDYRDTSKQFGSFLKDLNFKQAPRAPMILSTHPMTMLVDNEPGEGAPEKPAIRGLPRGVR